MFLGTLYYYLIIFHIFISLYQFINGILPK
jgi:hypothetical protein